MSRVAGLLDRHPYVLKAALDDPDYKDTTCVPVRINSIAHWFYKDKDVGEDINNLFPSVVPPWDATWYEYSAPTEIIAGGEVTDVTKLFPGLRRLGVIQGVSQIPEKDRLRAVEEDWIMDWMDKRNMVIEYESTIGFNRKMRLEKLKEYGKPARWMVSNIMFAEIAGSKKLQPLCSHFMFLHEDGSIFPEQLAMLAPVKQVVEYFFPIINYKPTYNVILSALFMPVFFSMSLLNCKNVEAVDEPVPKVLKAIRRSKKKRGMFTYKTLNIYDPGTKKKRASSDDSGEPESRRAFHICRGHWADHREHGLFGKESLKGIYWVPQHTKGIVDEGTVMKDYKLIKRDVDTPY